MSSEAENAKQYLDTIKEIGLDEFREVVKENPHNRKAALNVLSKHPDVFNTFSPNARVLKEARYILQGIDKESREEQRQQQADANRLSDEDVARIKEIEADPRWQSKNAAGHKDLVRERFLRLVGKFEAEE